jgi:hypothetical protein
MPTAYRNLNLIELCHYERRSWLVATYKASPHFLLGQLSIGLALDHWCLLLNRTCLGLNVGLLILLPCLQFGAGEALYRILGYEPMKAASRQSIFSCYNIQWNLMLQLRAQNFETTLNYYSIICDSIAMSPGVKDVFHFEKE